MCWNKILAVLLGSFMATAAIADQQKNVELLAASCASCHGTQGHSVGGTPSLAGLDELHFIEQLRQFKNGDRPSTVMIHHVNGYTEDEIRLMAKFFSMQR